MKRLLSLSVLGVCALSLANCTKPQPQVVEHHYYHTNTTRYVSTRPAPTVSTYSKPASVSGSSPETFQAVTPPASYSR
jgi:hypothetical protein